MTSLTILHHICTMLPINRFSYQCGGNYHAPTDCETIKRWLTKCADDSETANYISAHTKDVSISLPPVLYMRF